LVIAVVTKPFAGLFTVTFAPATAAPEASRTEPVMEPVVWARIGRAEKKKQNNAHNHLDLEIMVRTRILAKVLPRLRGSVCPVTFSTRSQAVLPESFFSV
jgi:hypothetical protein